MNLNGYGHRPPLRHDAQTDSSNVRVAEHTRVLTRLRDEKRAGRTGIVVGDDERRLSGTLDAVDVALANPQTPVGRPTRGAPGRIQTGAARR